MKKLVGISTGILYLSAVTCMAQQGAADLPDAPRQQPRTSASLTYTPPTQQERFRNYVRHTFSISSLLEAGVRGGIGQALDRPSQWPQGAEGFGDRMGSAAGEIVVRGSTEYLVADLFREDLRRTRCDSPCEQSALARAFDDTFVARRGDDGHRAFSVARLVGPIAAGTVAKETWYPGGSSNRQLAGEIGLNYGFTFVRSYVWELAHH
jgi:hypothetical protein